MKTILYVSAHEPFPALSGGQVDTWNRLLALKELGLTVDLIVTVKGSLRAEQVEALSGTVRKLIVVRRTCLIAAAFSRLPVQMAVRSPLRTLDVSSTRYDLVLLDNEFTGEILRNRTLCAERIAVRVQNDETAYQYKLAKAERRFLYRRYFRMEARRMARYIPSLWKNADALWFISHDELAGFRKRVEEEKCNCATSVPLGSFVPAGINLKLAGRPLLSTYRVLFVGTLAVTLNQDAIRWYLRYVHPQLLGEPDYELIVAGSTLGRNLDGFLGEVAATSRVRVICDLCDLRPLFEESSVFVNPMRFGAGVKLKTVESALRGLPVVSTSVGAEGSGLVNGVHCRVADTSADFATSVRMLLRNPASASDMRDRASEYIRSFYNHAESLRGAFNDLGIRL